MDYYANLIKLDVETLMKAGYDKETAQTKLNDIAQKVAEGKPIRDLYKDAQKMMSGKSNGQVMKNSLAYNGR